MRLIPKTQKARHEYCYFLHDQCAHALVEYEKGRHNFTSYNFGSESEALRFKKITKKTGSITALSMIGQSEKAKRVVLNAITMAMVSDCLHHIFEALSCMERRKVIVAFNLLRKPLTDNLVFLAWMLGREDDFFDRFTTRSPHAMTGKMIGNEREVILRSAIFQTKVSGILDADWLNSVLFKSSFRRGLYPIFQKAVHLITYLKEDVRMDSENSNFIQKSL